MVGFDFIDIHHHHHHHQHHVLIQSPGLNFILGLLRFEHFSSVAEIHLLPKARSLASQFLSRVVCFGICFDWGIQHTLCFNWVHRFRHGVKLAVGD
jgi:hypothetical protein